VRSFASTGSVIRPHRLICFVHGRESHRLEEELHIGVNIASFLVPRLAVSHFKASIYVECPP
jgi:hypothetical protein